jgi:hypothetical protein
MLEIWLSQLPQFWKIENSRLIRMKPLFLSLVILSVGFICPTRAWAAVATESNFVPLFNGRDFSGWTNVNCAPSTWNVRDGMIYCTGLPTGVLRTTRQVENFIWRSNGSIFSPVGTLGFSFGATR